MKFRYYITDLFNGVVSGTDDESVANDFAAAEEYFVVDSERGVWMIADGEETDIQQVEA